MDADYTSTSQLELALRTQRQCRSALYSLAYVKYMKKKR